MIHRLLIPWFVCSAVAFATLFYLEYRENRLPPNTPIAEHEKAYDRMRYEDVGIYLSLGSGGASLLAMIVASMFYKKQKESRGFPLD